MARRSLRRKVGREAIKSVLSSMLRWEPLEHPEEGFSVILGVPWDLRHVLSVNLRFVCATDIGQMRKLFIVFDRTHRPEMAEIERATREEFPSLPLEFLWYPPVSGRIVERVHVSTLYNSMNTTLALGRATTRYAVLHDFDLYPLRPDHFTSIVDALRTNSWRFSGHELTHFDGLEDRDLQIGTWTLGVDVEWLRANHSPVDCFHRVTKHRGQEFNLDPFAWLQFQTPDRGLVPARDELGFCHVRNLCSTYLRFLKRDALKVAWRLHYLWYLESLSGREGRLAEVTRAMDAAESAELHLDRLPADFSETHVTCANVLRDELSMMDRALFGEVRPDTVAYLDAFDRFLTRFGSREVLRASDGSTIWTPE